ncbi:hypothetical protein GCM10007169_09290 [Shewanella fodinae]|nr:hypothetical protein GCM10007169_09290 [Shewanella fodinae]
MLSLAIDKNRKISNELSVNRHVKRVVGGYWDSGVIGGLLGQPLICSVDEQASTVNLHDVS